MYDGNVNLNKTPPKLFKTIVGHYIIKIEDLSIQLKFFDDCQPVF